DRRTVAGCRDRLAGKGDLLDRPVLPGSDGDHAGVDVGALGKATRHDDRRARRNVAAELGKAREMIGMHRLIAGVVLVDAHGVREVRAELLERAAHALEDIVGFASQRRTAAQAASGRAFDLGSEPALEIKGLVAVEENPRTGLDRVGEARAASPSRSTDLIVSAAVGVTLVPVSPGWTMASFKPRNAGPRVLPLQSWRLRQGI